MDSITNIFRTGYGPSSSHTMGPARAAALFLENNRDSISCTVELYGSLAATGRGHLTDMALLKTLSPIPVEIVWKHDEFLPGHPNGMIFTATMADGSKAAPWTVYSTGGGAIKCPENPIEESCDIYPVTSMEELLEWCRRSGTCIWELAVQVEGEQILDFLAEAWNTMQSALKRGLEEEGVIPGGLGIPRKAASYLHKSTGYSESLKKRAALFAYALAVAEENACGGRVVTAPTCGSCGVLPSVLYYMKEFHGITEKRSLRAMATAGIIGALIKRNGSISGAEVGCQGEIGTACSMAAGAVVQLFGGSPGQVEYAAEMGLEHHLGLTCDPVRGLVQVPCIERNAFAASRALDADAYAIMSDGTHRIGFDRVVKTMLRTGHDLPSLYRETSMGGLALEQDQEPMENRDL